MKRSLSSRWRLAFVRMQIASADGRGGDADDRIGRFHNHRILAAITAATSNRITPFGGMLGNRQIHVRLYDVFFVARAVAIAFPTPARIVQPHAVTAPIALQERTEKIADHNVHVQK